MNYRTAIPVIMLLFAIGCTDTGSKRQVNSLSDSTTGKSYSHAATDSSQCVMNTRLFFAWYKKNFDTLNHIRIVQLTGTGNNTQYRVNTAEAEKYVSMLRWSGLFSEKFCRTKLDYFMEQDKLLLKDKQNDGPPTGFEADLMLMTQETDELLEKSETLPIRFIRPLQYAFLAPWNKLVFTFVPAGAGNMRKFLIDRIEWETR